MLATLALCWLAASGAAAQTTPAAPPVPNDGPAPPSVVVAVLGDARCPAPVVAAFTAAAVESVRGMVGNRPVAPLDPPRSATLGACTDAACVGGVVGDANGLAGVIVRLSRRRPRDPIAVHVEIVDPISGTPRGTPADGTVPVEAELAPGPALTPILTTLAASLPAPPVQARASLLLAISEDGATVTVNGEARGESPIAPFEVDPGTYNVEVSRPGFRTIAARVEVEAGQEARLDVDLEGSAPSTTGASGDADDEGPIYTRWYVLAGAGAAVVVLTVVIIVAASGGSGNDASNAIGVPPIE